MGQWVAKSLLLLDKLPSNSSSSSSSNDNSDKARLRGTLEHASIGSAVATAKASLHQEYTTTQRKLNPDGTYKMPNGPAPSGCVWDRNKGMWVDTLNFRKPSPADIANRHLMLDDNDVDVSDSSVDDGDTSPAAADEDNDGTHSS